MKPKINLQEYKDAFFWQMAGYPYYHSNLDDWAKVTNKKYYSALYGNLMRYKGGQLSAFVPKNEFLKSGEKQIAELLSGKDGFYKELKKVFVVLQKNNKELLEIVTKNDLKKFRKIWKKIYKIHCKAAQLFFSFDFAMTNWIGNLQKSDSAFCEKFNKASAPMGLSFIQEEENELYRIKKKYFCMDECKMMQEIKKHSARYCWTQNSYTGSAHLDFVDFLVRTNKDLKKVELIKPNSSLVSPKYRLLAKTLSLVAIFRDERKKMMLLLVEMMERDLHEFAERKKLKYKDLRWLGFYELSKASKNPYFKKQERYALLVNGKMIDVDKKDFDQIEKEYNKSSTNIPEIKGVIAQKGYAKGRVCIVKNINDCGKIKEGEILVVSMTRPDFLVAMKKAIAFVTDEGGITCHAAIVAREMKKPCIIGTKNATRILRDGNLIEVDANKGIIKIIK